MESGSLLINEWIMIVFYIAGVLLWGYFLKDRAAHSLADTFLAGRKVPGFIASFSTVATNLNANDFIGWAGAVYLTGVVMVHFPLQTAIVIAFLSLVMMKQLRQCNVYTLGEWLRKRYSPAVGNTYTFIWTFIWMPFGLGLFIYAGSVVMHTLVGWNLYVSIVALTLVAATYTLLGGFRAVVATDVLQLFFMFFPLVVLCILIWNAVGNPVKLLETLPAEKADLWSSTTSFGPISVILFGHLIMAMCFWCCDAQLVQRPLSTKNPNEAAISYLGAGFWYALLVPLLAIFPGLAAIKFFPNLTNNDFATPMLLKEFLPPGLYGVAIVGLLSGVFSSADSMINAFCTMFTTDIYQGIINKNANKERLLKVSRIAGVLFTMAGICTAISFKLFAKYGMFMYLASVLATILPPLGAVAVLGAVWKRCSPRGASVGLIVGFIFSLIFLGLDLNGTLAPIAKDSMFFRSLVIFVLTAVITCVVSLFEHFESPLVADEKTTHQTNTKTKVILYLLIAAIVGMYLAIILTFGI